MWPGQRQLHEDAVHRRVGVQPLDLGDEIGLGDRVVEAGLEGLHPRLDGLLALVADIDLAGRVLAHQHDGEPGRDPVLGFQSATSADLRAHAAREFLAVDDVGGHGVSSPVPSGLRRTYPAHRGVQSLPAAPA